MAVKYRHLAVSFMNCNFFSSTFPVSGASRTKNKQVPWIKPFNVQFQVRFYLCGFALGSVKVRCFIHGGKLFN